MTKKFLMKSQDKGKWKSETKGKGGGGLGMPDVGFELNELNNNDIKCNFLTFCHRMLNLLDLRLLSQNASLLYLKSLNIAEGELK
jgi:hypothetical protein